MNREDCFFLGKIVKPSGLKGQVQMHLDADDPARYSQLESVFIEINNQLVPFFIDEISIKSNGTAYVKFRETGSVEEAGALKGHEVYLPLTLLPPLGEDHYYYHEISGFTLCNADGEPQGVITEVNESANQYLATVKYKTAQALFPLNHQLFIKIDRQNQRIYFTIPDGLLDIYVNDGDEKSDDQ